MKSALLSLLVCLIGAGSLSGQIELEQIKLNQFVEIELNDGTQIIGEVVEIRAAEFIIATASLGQIEVSKYQIKKLSKLDEEQIREDGSVYFDNPIPTRNYISETAIGLKKGEGFYQNILLGAHTFSYGFSDRFTLSGGFETFSLFSGSAPIFFLAPKVTFPAANENIHFGIGGNVALVPGSFSSREAAGTLYGITTFGNVNHNLTVGLGFAYVVDQFADTPLFQIGGMTRIGKHFMMVTDNILVSDSSDLVVVGTWTLRYISKKVSVDIGFATQYSEGAIPVLGASIGF